MDNYELHEQNTRQDYLFNIKKGVDGLTQEQKENIKLIIEFHNTKNITYNKILIYNF